MAFSKARLFNFLFLLLTLLCFSPDVLAQQTVFPKNGLLDLRQQNLNANVFQLDGEWQFFWNQLLDPKKNPTTPNSLTQFPGFWHNIKNSKGESLPSFGYASYRLKILLPDEYEKLAFRIPDFYANYTLYINGELFAKEGQTGTDASNSKPFWLTRTITLDTEADSLDVVLQISNFHLAKGGASKSIYFGSARNLTLTDARETGMDFLLCGCLLMGGLFFLGLYLFARHDKAILFFSLFCILYSIRMIGTQNYGLHAIFPGINWLFSYKLEYIIFCACIGSFGLYTYFLYPKDFSKRVLQVILTVVTGMAIMVLLTSPTLFSNLLNYLLFIVLAYMTYSLFVFTKAVIKKRPGAKYGLWGNYVAAIVFGQVILHYFDVVPESKILTLAGYILFFFFQSLVISNKFSAYLVRAKEDAEAGLRVKSQFLSTMSHEIRTPLNAVIGISNLMQQDQTKGEQKNMGENLEMLSFSAQNLLSIVNNVLDYNKLEANKLHFEQIEMNAKSVAENVVKSFKPDADEKKIELKMQLDENIPNKLLGDPTRLTQVLNNLVNNAIKFTNKGSVLLELKLVETAAMKHTIEFRISDTGIGIDPTHLEKIFNPFAQADSSIARNFGGTGLGLTICKEILQMQDSDLLVESQPGKGASFWFLLQFTEPEITLLAQPAVTTNNEQALTGVSILLVEDNDLNARIAMNFLTRWGAKVDIAQNGKEAIDRFQPQYHQIILMDLQMPEIDGLEASRILRMQGTTCPIIALTANLATEVMADVSAAGMNDIIMKPFRPVELKNILLKYVAMNEITS
jgi:signal transduction histidine kinase/CheY-like chemotaxis protein